MDLPSPKMHLTIDLYQSIRCEISTRRNLHNDDRHGTIGVVGVPEKTQQRCVLPIEEFLEVFFRKRALFRMLMLSTPRPSCFLGLHIFFHAPRADPFD